MQIACCPTVPPLDFSAKALLAVAEVRLQALGDQAGVPQAPLMLRGSVCVESSMIFLRSLALVPTMLMLVSHEAPKRYQLSCSFESLQLKPALLIRHGL